jgi:hypothetical protein
MLGVVVLLGAMVDPFAQFYFRDPGGPRVPILPAAAVPRIGGGWLPSPPPPSVNYFLTAAAAAGRQPGDFVVSRKVTQAKLGDARQFPLVGKGRLWEIHYECQILGPDGPYAVYTDRTAIVLVP